MGLDEHKSEADELVRRYGSKDQGQRQAAGLLPDEEFREIVRRHIFGPVMVDVDGRAFQKLEGIEYDFTHKPGCSAIRASRGTDGRMFLRFASGPAGELPPSARERLERMNRLARYLATSPPNYEWTVSGRVHTATCKECGQTQTQFGALVSVRVAGRKLSREYAL